MAKTRDALSVEQGPARKGLQVRRYFTTAGTHPYDELTWDRRDAVITNWRDGTTAFEQRGLEFPSTWSQNATSIVAQKYFRGPLGTPQRESSVRQMVDRVAGTITRWGAKDGYFASDADAEAFQAELTHILVNQKAAFNSPVWFNVGVEPDPQSSACQPYDALVSTPTGMVPIGELVERRAIGTVVYDAHGETRVRAVKANGDKRVYRVRLRNGSFMEATADHLVYAVPERRTPGAWLRVDELRPGMRLHLYPHRASTDDVVGRLATSLERRSEEGGGTTTLVRSEPTSREASEAALAGWLQADGFVGQYRTGTNTSLTVEFQTATEEEYDWVEGHLQAIFPGVHQHVRTFKTVDATLTGRRIRLYGEVLRPFVESWGLLARRHELRVPARLWNASNEAVAAYLRSVFQADGYVTVRGGSALVAVAVISERWTEDLQVLLLRLGVYSRRLRKAEVRPDRSDLFEVGIGMRSERATFRSKVGFLSAKKVATLDASLGLDGKACPSLREEEIVTLEDRGVQPVFDIQTDSGEYLSNNIRVHNCFILSVDDTMPSILNWYVEEGMIFKGGSGSGVNLSTIRSSKEQLGNGGEASGPVSFMRGADASAGTIKSGGKCFREGTLVATPSGMQPIERLRIGDEVLTHRGPRAVADFMRNGRRQCYRVLTREGYEVEVTAGHKFAYWNSIDGHFAVKPIEEFKPGDALYALLEPCGGGTTIPLLPPEIADPAHATTTVEMSLPTELDERLAYVVGLMYGDGELRIEYPYRVRVSFAKDAAGRLSAQRFRDYSKDLFGEEPLLLGDADGCQQLGFTRKRLVEFLVANGIAKGKADTLGFPSMLFRARPGVRAAFIAGVIDADGSYQRRGGWSITSIDRAFLVDLQRLLLTLGVPAKLKLSREQNGAWRRLYRLHIIGHTFVQRLVEHIAPHSAKARIMYEPSPGADKGWSYRPSLLKPLAAHVRQRGGYRLIQRSVGMNETSGYGAVATLVRHPEAAVAGYAQELSTCVQLTLEAITPTEVAETYDIEVEDVHLLSANGIYSSNTRRAAKMVILNVDHPDVRDFIWCKAREEHKARVLRDAGFDMDLDGRDSISIQYQNANNSVRVTDDFMRAYEADGTFDLKAVLDGRTTETVRARELMREIAQAAWECADPGMQYDTTINDWHTTPESGRINASNPCSEYMHLDNSACNLASLNLMKFLRDDDVFDVEAYRHAIDIVFLAQEIIVGNSSYPTERIAKNAVDYRQLGIGYANLGALLMTQGLPYDSDTGRAWAGAITALLTGQSYRTSARVAQVVGPFAGYAKNREPMLGVIAKHRRAVDDIAADLVQPDLLEAARQSWDDALQLGREFGFRNAQASVLAPTGTISFLMDCDTTGIEPDLALVKTKKLVGGGSMSIVNQTVPRALRKLGYAEEHVQAIVEYIAENNSVKGAPVLREEHHPVFDCAMGDSPIHYMGHIRMMAAAQPFISGAISKTANLPESATVEDVERVYVEGWKLGLKALAIYRDNCKVGQPLSADKKVTTDTGAVIEVERAPVRRRLPKSRPSTTTSFRVGDIEGYLTAGSYPDDGLGEIFVKVSKQGSTLSGVMDAFAIAVSVGLQYGVPLEALVAKFTNMIFEPNGMTDDPDVRIAQSLVDYLARRLAIDYLDTETRHALGIRTIAERTAALNGVEPPAPAAPPTSTSPAASTSAATAASTPAVAPKPTSGAAEAPNPPAPKPAAPAQPVVASGLAFTPGTAAVDAPFCSTCGVRMRPAGSCFVCESCGSTSGCS
jgi:ribonucleoside-diphosphate reductase alpha chain